MDDAFHQAVMVAEVLAALAVRPGGVYADGTLGGGNHAAAILERSQPDGRLYGCDLDPEAMSRAQVRLEPFAGRFVLREGSYVTLPEWVPAGSCDGVMLDLGVSSHELDTAARGFSLRHDGPLDMRFSPHSSPTAAALVNETPVAELARIFRELGEEPAALRLARAIDQERRRTRIETTGHLVAVTERVLPPRGRGVHPATRLFQALRMAVNREVETIREGLLAAWKLLRENGRLVCIAFHGGEARLVKEFGHRLSRNYEVVGPVDRPEFRRPQTPQLRWVHRHAVRPSREEVRVNRRSRSSLLYAFERIP